MCFLLVVAVAALLVSLQSLSKPFPAGDRCFYWWVMDPC